MDERFFLVISDKKDINEFQVGGMKRFLLSHDKLPDNS
jgi:hypothetical protein